MLAYSKILTGAAGLALAATGASPAAAQYYPQQQGYGYPGGGNAVSQAINQVLGAGRNGAYGASAEGYVIDRCARAAEAQVNRTGYQYNRNRGLDYGGTPYRTYNGYNGARTARVVGITRVERRPNGGMKVFGLLDSGMMYNRSAYQGGDQAGDLQFGCRVDARGSVTNVDINRSSSRAYQGY